MADTNTEQEQQLPPDPLSMAIEMLMDTLAGMPKSALDPQKSEAARNMILLSGAMAQIESARALRSLTDKIDSVYYELRAIRERLDA